MDLSHISNLRLLNQQVTQTKFKSPKEIVKWMGAMQAQDLNMAKWAIGVRLPDSTEKLIEAAIDKGEIIRTHLLRPTWHFVSSEDIHWMLSLTAPQIKARMKSSDKALGLTDAVYNKSNALLEKLLFGKDLSREILVAEFKKAEIPIDENRAWRLLMRAELDGIICSGKTMGSKQTYTLLLESVPKTKTLYRDEALAKLAQRYFASHGPATLQDFVWWSGLSVTESRKALDMVKSNFITETINNHTYILADNVSVAKPNKDVVYLLPAFDEFLISYKDRSASLPFKNHLKAVSNNGIFYPTIVVNGQVLGAWKRTIKKDNVTLDTTYFDSPDKSIKNLVEKEFSKFRQFLCKTVS